MAQTTRSYLDLTGLKYVLSKLNGGTTGTGVVTNVSQTNGKISATRSLIDDSLLDSTLKGNIVKSVKLAGNTVGETTTITLTPTLLSGVDGEVTTATITVPAASVIGADGFLKVTDKKVVLDTTKVEGGATESVDPASTKLASKLYVDEAAKKAADDAITKAVVYKGAVATLPTEGMANGDMYKLTTAISTPVSAKAGDTAIYNGKTASWDIIPSGNDIEYTGVKVGDTTVIDATVGGDVTFAAGDKLSVVGAAGTVTYSHAAMTNDQSAKASDLYKVSVDKFGHAILGDAVDVDAIATNKANAAVNALNGSAVIVNAEADDTDAATATTTTFYNVKQTNGVIAQDEAAVIFQTITAAEIDAIFNA